jgi:phosphoribosylamine--glycine ligase
MKILVVGSGGREHALVWKLAQSDAVAKVFTAPGNPGTAIHGENVPIKADDIEGLKAFALKEGIDLTVVGPELPLTLGIVDAFNDAGLKIFGPTREAAELEGSKVFCKELMERYGIPTAEYKKFEERPTGWPAARGPLYAIQRTRPSRP